MVKGKNWLHSATKETVFKALPSEHSERDRRIFLREADRKKRALAPEAAPCGQLCFAGANIISPREAEIEGKNLRPSLDEKGFFSAEASKLAKDSETDAGREGYFGLFDRRLTEQRGVEGYKHEGYARFRKKEIDLELLEKREKQQLLIKSELDKQVEEKRKRKLLEMKKKKEEDEKEEQRIKREQEELAMLHKQEEMSRGFNILAYNEHDNVKVEDTPIKNPNKPLLNNFSIQGYNPNPYLMKPPQPPPLPKTNLKVVPNQLLEEYQRQRQLQLNKEQALYQREQIILEKERQLQLMMERISIHKHPKFDQPAVRPESKDTCEESHESLMLRLPTRDSNNLMESMRRGEELEQSLVSDTKLVAVSGGRMDKTWRENLEKSVQTLKCEGKGVDSGEVIEESIVRV
eukprot:TRINITY_DN9422_c0_g2_i2.p1 TRINITY_DN9422_c0_g2~~TRINITY_DN9422_c0_g2_i2.p1  ORF type:complete len:405 (+),score=78.66 TRINITY_DN9422_c0_g2_i2:250-1464(+)